jgi:acetyltransferase-like isoleucine patch superfamily enzyme
VNIRYSFWKRLLILERFKYGYVGKNSKIIRPYILSKKKNIFIGNNVTIRDFARIQTVNKWNNQVFAPKIIIGNNVNIEQGIHLTCSNRVEIQDGCSISSYCLITDIDHEYSDINKRILEQPIIVNQTIIKKYCFIGAGVKIMAGVTIGTHSIIGANSVVTKDIPDYCVAVGIPSKIIKRYDFEAKKWLKTDSEGNFLNKNSTN